MKIETTTVHQEANPILDTKAKDLYYIIISNTKGSKMIINVGQKTHDLLNTLQKEDKK